MVVPPDWRTLGFTSGRRTYAGNRRVGGVPNSDHLDGTAADFTAPVHVLRQRFGPNVRILDEKDHRHVSGLSNVPYYGNRGTYGLVNGVDTTAPKGQPPVRRPDPITQRLVPDMWGRGGPSQLNDEPLFGGMNADQMGGQMAMQQPTQMQLPNEQIAAPKPKAFGKGGVGWAILGSIGDALSAYGGRQGTFAPAMQDLMQQQNEERRFQQKLQMEAAERQARANEPPAQIRLANYVLGMDPEARRQTLGALDMIDPNYQEVTDEQGNVRRVLAPRAGAMPKAPPQVGAVQGGYRYLGGDPADPQSWSKM